MASPPAISVIVPTHGRPAFLAEALESLRHQTMADFECLVIDDASPTPVELPIDDPRFRLIRRDTNGGAGAARNTGLRAATGAGIVFLDDDDLFTPDRLAIAADLLPRAPIGLCASGVMGSSRVIVPALDGDVADRILDTTTPHLGITTVRRDACLEFDESYRTCQDLEWWLRMARTAPVAVDPRLGWLWRSHASERRTSGPGQRLADSRKLLADHREYFARHRRAAAFRWLRIAILAAQAGDAKTRWSAAARAIRLDPRPSVALRAARTALYPWAHRQRLPARPDESHALLGPAVVDRPPPLTDEGPRHGAAEESGPSISVIVPTSGRPAFLAEALESLRSQTMADFECLVVDDASPTPVELPIDDPRFHLIRRDTNGGAGAARNTGLRAATGAGIVFLDDDDLFTPDRLAIAADLLPRAPIGLCGSGRVGSTEMTVPGLDGNVADRILDATTPHLGTTSVRRSLCLEFDESYRTCEDLDWWLRMARTAPVAVDPRLGWLWRSHAGERGTSGATRRIADSRKLLADHHDYFARHRRAAAFRWLRIAILAAQAGDAKTRWSAAVHAIRLDPRPGTTLRATRTALYPGAHRRTR